MERKISNYINRTFGTRILSKWIVLLFDVSITAFTYGIAYILRYNFHSEQIQFILYLEHTFYTVLLFTIAFIVFRSFDGIIRHSGEADAKKLMLACSTASAASIVLSLAGRQFNNPPLTLPVSITIIHAFLNITLLLFSRYVIKVLFYQATRNNAAPTAVIIYGAGRRGTQVMQVLKRDTQHNYQITAFLDDNPSKVDKTIEGVKIYPSEKLPELLKKVVVKELIISIQNPDNDKKEEVVNTCLNKHILIKSVSPVEDWINGNLSMRQIRNYAIEDLLGRDPIRLENNIATQAIAHKIIMVTGAAGSIGSEIVRQLVHYKPNKLILLDQAESDLYDLQMELYFKLKESDIQCDYIVADITNKNRMAELFAVNKPQMIFHAAAYKHVPLMEVNAREAIEVNIYGTVHIADLAVEHQVEKFVMISTDKAVNPTSVMGATKRAAEIYIQEKTRNAGNTVFITTRFGNVLGSNGSVVQYFKKQIDAGGPLTITHPEVTRYFMTIPEACQLVLEAAVMGKTSEIYMFDMGEPVKIVDLATKMAMLSGLEPGKDIAFVFTGLRPGEKLHEELMHANENTLPTHNAKIRIAHTSQYDSSAVLQHLEAMQVAVWSGNTSEGVRFLKKLVPEFLSQNSNFTALDQA